MGSKTVRIVFTTGKSYQGRDYFAGDVAEVEENWARRWVGSGAARLHVSEQPLPPPPPLTSLASVEILQDRDPKPGRRRGRK